MSAHELALFLDSVSEKIETQPPDVIADDEVQMALGTLAKICTDRLDSDDSRETP